MFGQCKNGPPGGDAGTPGRIAENFDVFGFELTAGQMAALDALDTGVRNGPDPDVARPEAFARIIPEQ